MVEHSRRRPEQGAETYRTSRHLSLLEAAALTVLAAVGVAVVALPSSASAGRLKDIARWEGVEDNSLVGVGLVVGLQGTGDGSPAAREMIRNLVATLELSFDAKSLKSKNAAVVTVTGVLPPFSRKGNRVDVTVSSMFDARSLAGGTLLPAQLKDPEGRVTVALADGPLAIGGVSAAGGGSSKVKNHTTVGRIPGGAKVLRDVAPWIADRELLRLSLDQPDFHTAVDVRRAINHQLMGDFAEAVDPGTIEVTVPPRYQGLVAELVARLEVLEVSVDVPARVVVNERTGTVVMGERVRIAPVAVAHGSLSIEVDTVEGVSQPAPFSNGETVTTVEGDVQIEEEPAPLQVLQGVSIGEVVGALNQLGVSPRDLISILQAIRAAGALDAELEVI